MSAVAEQDAPTVADVLVSQPESSALFMATVRELRLVKKSRRPVRGPDGEEVDLTTGETIEFRDGVLRVPLGPKAEMEIAHGERVKAAPILEWLENHKLKGEPGCAEGFWRVDPTAPPASELEIQTLQRMALELDADGLERFIEQESAGWGREQLLTVAHGTLERIRSRTDEQEQALAAARAEGEAAAKKG